MNNQLTTTTHNETTYTLIAVPQWNTFAVVTEEPGMHPYTKHFGTIGEAAFYFDTLPDTNYAELFPTETEETPEEVATEETTQPAPYTIPTTLTFTEITKGEYTAAFTPDGFAMNLTKGKLGWSVTSTEHDSVDVMADYDTEDTDRVRWVRTKKQAINCALEFAQHFTQCLIENWVDDAQYA